MFIPAKKAVKNFGQIMKQNIRRQTSFEFRYMEKIVLKSWKMCQKSHREKIAC